MLSVLIWLPLGATLVGVLLPEKLTGRITFLASLATLGIAIALFAGFDHFTTGLQHVTDHVWISALGIHYKLGVDGLNVLLIMLTAIIFTSSILAANFQKWKRTKLFYFHFALAESAVFGAFCAQDLILFVVFFDLMLIPFYFLIGTWGGKKRIQATVKLVIYTLVGSLFMLVAAISTGVIAAQASGHLSFAFTDLQHQLLPIGSQRWIFLLFAAAFLVKMPAFPVHGWMPDGYRAMPLPVLAAFSAILSKVAAYGFLRISLPLFPHAAVDYQVLLLVIGLVSIIYGSAIAFTQDNFRLILGFSSVAQLGFITLGIFSLRSEGVQGAIFQMVNHGLVVGPLFLIIGILAARAGGSEDLRDMGGIAIKAPILAAIFLIVAFATLAMPGSPNFVGEFLILLGVFRTKISISIIAFIGVVLASVYMLRAYIRSMHNPAPSDVTSREIGFADSLAIVPVVIVILALAFYPQGALKKSDLAARETVRAPSLVLAGQRLTGRLIPLRFQSPLTNGKVEK